MTLKSLRKEDGNKLLYQILSLVCLGLKESEFEGNFINDQFNGFGRLENKMDVSVYKGTFLNGLKFGQGKIRDTSGQFDGEFRDNLKNGKGHIYLEGEVNYEGEWLNDEKHGYGRFQEDKNKVYEG